jgi:hypothetical protein
MEHMGWTCSSSSKNRSMSSQWILATSNLFTVSVTDGIKALVPCLDHLLSDSCTLNKKEKRRLAKHRVLENKSLSTFRLTNRQWARVRDWTTRTSGTNPKVTSQPGSPTVHRRPVQVHLEDNLGGFILKTRCSKTPNCLGLCTTNADQEHESVEVRNIPKRTTCGQKTQRGSSRRYVSEQHSRRLGQR